MIQLFAIFAELYSRLIKLIAYGPWGHRVHQGLIKLFRAAYSIKYENIEQFKTLGDFFLRDQELKLGNSSLVSPAEARLIGPVEQVNLSKNIKVKGMKYNWTEFPELAGITQIEAYFWNLYLAPHNYHWFHAPCDAYDIEAIRISGKKLPVNSLGKLLTSRLYQVNERLSFRWKHPELGMVFMICVGAMGVSGILSSLGEVEYGRWRTLKDFVSKGDRLGGFRLGSSVLLIVENNCQIVDLEPRLELGQNLVRS